ncbi:hypothetical protein LMJ38_05255 [Streptomyces sp. R1]|uniref:hypothetical protein n=1 Tax=unclassified Streptomyces TaxID=2593676 RepID=UPI000776751B|nr:MULTISPECIES: hypothetical protein [unclassified Streptomyces]MCC8335336.1 hypothetical protein [Streptomyces sp. R1]MDA4887315.1 hypothetical protein [Streptomyces sp. MS2A]
MPRGRHRHSPPLHRLLPPSAIAGVSVVCAVGPWLFSETLILRALAAAAAVTAVVGAVVMRHWDAQAGRQVADLTRARASDEWRFEERLAELESDLEESRELRQKLEHRLRAKRTELAGLRNEHASLLRRYATAETERASALEGRRLLEIEAAPQAPALPAARTAPAQETPETVAEKAEKAPVEESGGAEEAAVPAVFSPEGSRLFLRANAALARFDAGAPAGPDGGDRAEAADDSGGDGGGDGGGESPAAPEAAQEDEAQGQSEAADGHERTAAASPTSPSDERPAQPTESTRPTQSAQPTRRADGHFTVPTAVAVVPAAPARRPVVEGGFDFFGTKAPEGPADRADATDTAAASDAALETVQNEDLADVVGQEALALHKAEAEVSFKQAGEESRDVSQVIDLTAHDETEQIDVQGLRSAVS